MKWRRQGNDPKTCVAIRKKADSQSLDVVNDSLALYKPFPEQSHVIEPERVQR
jgi:hypothetical protein